MSCASASSLSIYKYTKYNTEYVIQRYVKYLGERNKAKCIHCVRIAEGNI